MVKLRKYFNDMQLEVLAVEYKVMLSEILTFNDLLPKIVIGGTL
jgi:hypothetical protein